MKSILHELFYGNVRPTEAEFGPDTELAKKSDEMIEYEEKLTSTLRGDEKDLFKNYLNACQHAYGANDCAFFVMGVRLGAQLIFDIFLSDERELFYL